MKSPVRFALLTLAVFSATLVSDAVTPPPSSAEAESGVKRSIAGEYAGTWQSDTDSGKFRLTLKQEGGVWTAESSFTFHDAEIPTKASALKIDGAKVELVLDWEMEGATSQSRLIGEWSGNKIDGIYDSKSADSVTTGTWTVTRK